MRAMEKGASMETGVKQLVKQSLPVYGKKLPPG
jgi:hypothetical protein